MLQIVGERWQILYHSQGCYFPRELVVANILSVLRRQLNRSAILFDLPKHVFLALNIVYLFSSCEIKEQQPNANTWVLSQIKKNPCE
jgi:hypothetical protein